MGGVISWFNAQDDSEESKGKSRSKISGTKLETRRLYPFGKIQHINDYEAAIDKYLVWRRGDRNWRYTFYDGIYKYPEQPDDDCVADLCKFIKKLLSSRRLAHSFPDSTIVDDNSVATKYPLPGFRIAGAQYFVIPVELLILIIAYLKKFPADLREHAITNVEFKSTNGKTVIASLNELYQFDNKFRPSGEKPLQELIRLVKPNIDKEFVEGAKNIRIHIEKLYEKVVGIRLQQENALKGEQEQFYQLFVALAELLWKCIYSDKDKKKYNVGQDDFVSSIVIDGRSIYFSNFRPYKEEGFTRTFFIDFGLTPYQRGRLVRRLCEIATYRMSCVKDLHLFHALQDGINQLSKKFNEDFLSFVKMTAKEDGDKVMKIALRLYRRATQFDMFIAEGVSARRRAAEGDWQRVRRQVDDIREKRLTGYAQLSDFLERGLAVAVMEISRVADRHENLVVRIRDLMSTIRTELSVARTVELVTTLNQISRESSDQIHLLWGALIVSWIGVSSYTNEFIDQFGGGAEKRILLVAHGIVLALLLAGLVWSLRHRIKKALALFRRKK